MIRNDDEKRYTYHVNLWLDDRGVETLEHLKTQYGSSISGALRAGLEMIRKQIGLDNDSSSKG